MKKALSLILCFVLLLGTIAVGGEGFAELTDAFSLKASAETYGVLTYEISDGKVTITGCDKTAAGDLEIPSEIEGYPVTGIGNSAFDGCTGLTSVTILDSVTSIGEEAFEDCTGLTSVTIPGSVTNIDYGAFQNCHGLTNVTIPDSVTSIGDRAFTSCNGLTSITIGNGVTSIGSSAFAYCKGLASLTIPGSVTSIGDGAFYECTGLESIEVDEGNTVYHSSGNCLIETVSKTLIAGCNNSVIPDDGSVTSIGDRAFYWCTGLTEVTIPDSVTSIGKYAFVLCTGLASIEVDEGNTVYHSSGNCLIETESKTLIAGCKNSVIPDDGSVTSIGRTAFYFCNGLKSVTIPESVTSIGEFAFTDCTALTSLTIPASVTSIGESAFYECAGLTSIEADEGNTVYHSAGNCLIETESKTLIAGCNNSVIPDDGSVTSIGYGAFSDRKDLKSVTIPDTVTSIGKEAFLGCIGLTSIAIPDGVTSIPQAVFFHCSGLTGIIIPDSVTSIGNQAFERCTGLTDVYFTGTEEEWNAITIYKNNDELQTAAIHYNYVPAPHTVTWNLDGGNINGNTESVVQNYFVGDTIVPPADPEKEGFTFTGWTSEVAAVMPDADIIYTATYIDNIGTYGVLTCEINDGKVTITGCDQSAAGALEIPSKIYGFPVTGIGYRAFAGCTGLTEVTIPDSVTSIDWYAFSGCTGLKSITIPGSVTSIGDDVFAYCEGLTSVTIGNGVTRIDDSAFRGCTGLTSIEVDEGNTVYHSAGNCLIETEGKTLILGSNNSVIPDDGSVTSIGYGAFSGFAGLTEVTIPDSVTSIGDSAFSGCTGLESVTIGNSVTSIDDRAFYDCTGLTEVTIPGSVTSIGDRAFSDCTGLTGITIPDSVTSIGDWAFAGCAGLTSVIIGNGVTIIGEYVFSGCAGLTGITIPGSVTSIGSYAFEDCAGLTSVTIPDSVTSIGEWAFVKCTDLTSVTIPDSVTSIGKAAFSHCTGLTSIEVDEDNTIYHSAGNCLIEIESQTLIAGCKNSVIPDDGSVTSIGEYAFLGCTGLTDITIPGSVTSIGDYAFTFCSGLTSVTIHEGVTNIGFCTFSDCTGLTDVYYTGTEEEWNAISIDEYNKRLQNASIHYNHTVTWNLDGGNINGNTESVVQNYFVGDTIVPPADPEKEGFTFTGWTSEVATVMPDADIIYTATYISNIQTYGVLTCEINDGNVTITDCDESAAGALEIPSEIEGYPVTSIGDSAFERCQGLTNVTIPDSVISIGNQAFEDCTHLTSVTVPDSVISIGDCAFSGCIGLTSIEVDEGNTVYHSAGNCLIDTESKMLIAGCNNSVIPDDGSVTSIGDRAFAECTGLTSITIPDSVTNIGVGAFFGCAGLTGITIPDSVTSISNYAFDSCAGLTSIEVDEGNTVYHSAGNCVIETESKTLISGCKNSVIPDDGSVTSIGFGAFDGCTGLTGITIPDSITSIGGWAFFGCKDLKEITIPDSVTDIGSYAFMFCTGLTSVIIGKSVTSIRQYTFCYCTGLVSVVIPDSVTSIEGDAFELHIDEEELPFLQEEYNRTVAKGMAFYDELPIECFKEAIDHPDSSLTDVYYTGTEEEWNAITNIGNNDDLLNASIHYNYAPVPHTVTWNLDGGNINGNTESVVQNYFVGDTIVPPADPEKEGFTFTGWTSEVAAVMPDADIVYTATYISNILTYGALTYGIIDGEVIITDCDESAAGALEIPSEIDGYPVTSIGYRAFAGCTGLTEVTIPGSVTSIGDWAFHGCTGLTGITVPGSVTSIGEGVFYYCTGLTSIEVDEGNTVYHSAGNCVIETESKTLIAGCNNSVIPDDGSVTSIGNSAFEGCTGFTEVTIPDSVTSIGSYAFYGCTGLTSITIGKNVTSIRNGAFYWCTGLTDVYYNGRDDEWNAITIGEENDDLLNAGYHNLVFNLGEETYSFKNFGGIDCCNPLCFQPGHCFGMAMTCAGYYTGDLVRPETGFESGSLYAETASAAIKDPIHYYQLKQGSIVEQSTVAGGRGFKNLGTRYDPSSDWSEVTDYVKNHDYDNKGSLQIGFKGSIQVNSRKRNINHAVNFLYYKEVDGQQRIYAYDNEYPDREIYFYKDSSGTIYQSVGGEPERRIECIALRDVSLYLSKAGKFDSTKSFYAEIGAIIISNATAYFMETDNEDAEEVIIEVPDGVTEVTIIPQEDNATFQYMGVEYSFDKVDDDTVGKFILAVTDEDGSTVEQPVFEIENDSELKALTEAKAAAKVEIDKVVRAGASDKVKALAETAKKNIDAATRIDEVNAAKKNGIDAINAQLASEKAAAPVIDGFGIVNGNKGTLNADYKSTVIFHTTAKAPDGYKIVWSNGQEGDECKFTAIKSEYKISAKLVNISTGETVQTTEEVTVKVSATFIAKIIAFFKGLFHMLPTYEDFKKQ